MRRTLLRLELPIKVALVSLLSTCCFLHLTDLCVQTTALALNVASVEIARRASTIPNPTLLEQNALVAVTVALATMTTPPLDALAAVTAAQAMMAIPPPDALAEDLQVTTTPLEALAVLAGDLAAMMIPLETPVALAGDLAVMMIPLEAPVALALGRVTTTTRAVT